MANQILFINSEVPESIDVKENTILPMLDLMFQRSIVEGDTVHILKGETDINFCETLIENLNAYQEDYKFSMNLQKHQHAQVGLSQEDILKRFQDLDLLYEALDSCYDLEDTGNADSFTQKNYEELTKLSGLQLWADWRKAHGRAV